MSDKENGSRTPDAAPGVLLAGERRIITTNRAKSQARTIPPMPPVESGISIRDYCKSLVEGGYFEECQAVTGELGPIAVIGSPIVLVGMRADCTLIWVCRTRLPRGWSDPFQTFLIRPGGGRGGAFKYARQLAEMIRRNAEKEAAYREFQRGGRQ